MPSLLTVKSLLPVGCSHAARLARRERAIGANGYWKKLYSAQHHNFKRLFRSPETQCSFWGTVLQPGKHVRSLQLRMQPRLPPNIRHHEWPLLQVALYIESITVQSIGESGRHTLCHVHGIKAIFIPYTPVRLKPRCQARETGSHRGDLGTVSGPGHATSCRGHAMTQW